MKVNQTGKIIFNGRFNPERIHVKTEDGVKYSFEIPGNYEQWHINNIVRDYNNGERTLILS